MQQPSPPSRPTSSPVYPTSQALRTSVPQSYGLGSLWRLVPIARASISLYGASRCIRAISVWLSVGGCCYGCLRLSVCILECPVSPTVTSRVYPLCAAGSRSVCLGSVGLFLMGCWSGLWSVTWSLSVGRAVPGTPSVVYRLTSFASAHRCRYRVSSVP